MLKNILLVVLIVALATTSIVYFSGNLTPVSASAAEQTAQDTIRTITVSGSGKVSRDPDLATISIGVQTQHENAAKAVESNNAQATKLVAALKAAGISAEDIQTTNFSIYPQQQYGPNNEILGVMYIVNNTVYVKLKNLAKVGEILDIAVKAGANNISGINFGLADQEEATQEALQAAIKNAQDRASVIAEAAGVGLGSIQNIQTSISGGAIPMYDRYMMSAAPAAPAEVPVSPGQLDITADVTIVYEIGPK